MSFSQTEQQERTVGPVRRMEARRRQLSIFSFILLIFWLCIGVCSLSVHQEWEASIQEREKLESCTNLMMVEQLSLCLPKIFLYMNGKKNKRNKLHVTVDRRLLPNIEVYIQIIIIIMIIIIITITVSRPVQYLYYTIKLF